MKTNSIFKIALGSLVGLAFAACADEVAYTPAPQEDATKNYVKVDETAPRKLEVDGADIKVPFVRTNAAGAMDVAVAIQDTSATGIFSLKNNTISFADGETTAYAVVTYSYDALDPTTSYLITVGLANETDGSMYTAINLPMTCSKAWQNLGVAQFYEGWWTEALVERQLLKAPDGSETYRLVAPFDAATVEAAGLTWAGGMPYIEFAIDENGTVTYDGILDLGIGISGYRAFNAHPTALGYSSYAPYNQVLAEGLVRFYWIPVYGVNATSVGKGSYGWWSQISAAYVSFPGGPDLVEVLGL